MPRSPAAPRVREQHSNPLLRHRIPAAGTGGAGPVGPLPVRPPALFGPRMRSTISVQVRGGGVLLPSLAGPSEPYLPADAAGRGRGVRVRLGDR